MEQEVISVSLEIMEAVPAVVVSGMMAGSLVVLAAGALVGCFKTLISVIGR